MFSCVLVKRKGELSPRGVDRGWPHQVALPADACTGRKYVTKHEFCRGLSLCQRGLSFRRDDRDYVVFCFAERTDAALFQAAFGGAFIDPADRPNPRRARKR